MNLFTQVLLLAQVSPDDAVVREIGRLQRNYEFLSYGLTVAWLIMVIYVLMMVARERRLKQEIARLKAMLEEKPRVGSPSQSNAAGGTSSNAPGNRQSTLQRVD